MTTNRQRDARPSAVAAERAGVGFDFRSLRREEDDSVVLAFGGDGVER
jgi:hypothetical protein